MGIEENSMELEYQKLDEVGKGSFGKVYKAKDKDNQIVAMKIVEKQANLNLKKEFEILNRAAHPNVLKAVRMFKGAKGRQILITDYIEGGSLETLLKETSLSEEQMKPIVKQILQALAHLEKKKIAHFDIKPSNILLGENNKPILADFGLALKHSDYIKHPTTRGTPEYMSTDMLEGVLDKRLLKSDVYALGITVKQMRVGLKVNNVDNEFFAVASPELLDFYFNSINPYEIRPTAKELLGHDWLSDQINKTWMDKISDLLKIKQ